MYCIRRRNMIHGKKIFVFELANYWTPTSVGFGKLEILASHKWVSRKEYVNTTWFTMTNRSSMEWNIYVKYVQKSVSR